MKPLGKFVTAIFGLVAIAVEVEHAGAREFTDAEGRKIEAEIQRVRPPNVVLVRGDKKTFLFPIAKLSATDQIYVEKWRVENPDINLEYRFDKQKISSKGDAQKRDEEWAYRVTVENRGLEDLEGLKVEYTIFKQLHDRAARARKTISGQLAGSAEIEKLESQRSTAFETDPIGTSKVSKVTTSGQGIYRETTSEKWNEDLTGITVTVTYRGKVVDTREYGIVK